MGTCINALTEGKPHVPYRNSKLTFFLKDALGGNSKTTLICTASKQMVHVEESIQTLNFAQRAKKIKTKAAANVMRSPQEMLLMIEKLKAEVRALRAQLEENGIKPNIAAYKLKADTAAPTPANDNEETKEEEENGEGETPAEEEDKEVMPGEEPTEEPLE